MKRYKITYKQLFNDKVLTDSYVRTVSNYGELIGIERRLYEDPHVFLVEWEELTNDNE